MILLRLAFLSLWNRKVTTFLTLLSLSLSVALLLGVQHIRFSAERSFESTISQTDLIVGARSGPLQLLLFSVFHIGKPTQSLSWKSYERWKKHKDVKWAVPISIGDSHKGFPVVATTLDYFSHYKYANERSLNFQKGRGFQGSSEVILGYQVFKQLKYDLKTKMVLAHGTGEVSLHHHEDLPFEVVGVLEPTGTPVDRSLFISLEAMESLHEGWEEGIPSKLKSSSYEGKKEGLEPDSHKEDAHEHGEHHEEGSHDFEEAHNEDEAHNENEAHDHKSSHGKGHQEPDFHDERHERRPQQITAFFLGLKSKVGILHLKHEIENNPHESLSAILPGATLYEFWQSLSGAEKWMGLVVILVFILSIIGLLLNLLSTLNERRREMAILRSVGAHSRFIFGLLVFEAGILTLLGEVLGTLWMFLGLTSAQPFLESHYGLTTALLDITFMDLFYLGIIFISALLFGLLPAFMAYRNSLVDGLTPKI